MNPDHKQGAREHNDPSLQRAFGFDADETQWYQRLRESGAHDALGHIGDYELLDEIGRGGQGVVFKARQPRTGREIAVKRLSAGAFATPEMRARFEREIEAAVALDHPNIITVFGTEIVDGQQLLAMKWVDGVPIDRWARPPHEPRRPIREVLELFTVACDAVHHAHQRGVIHRDLKPSNILVDKENRPFVLDFGLAKVAREIGHAASITMTGQFLGTPAFAAPEQIRGDVRAVDVRTDVYALGAILYRLLTGVLPFTDTGDLPALMQNVLHREPPRPSFHDVNLNREIDVILLKALAKDKDQRYASVDTLADDLRRFLTGQAVLAHPPSTVYQVRKFVRKHRAAVAATTVVAALLMSATVLSTTLYFRAKKETARANREADAQIAINQFLSRFLGGAAPWPVGGNPDITVREALESAATVLDDKKSTYPPDVEAELRTTISGALLGVGSVKGALPISSKAVQLSRQVVAAGGLPCLASYNALGRAQAGLDDFVGAIATFREQLHLSREYLIDDPQLGRSGILRWLVKIQLAKGEFREAEQTAREAIVADGEMEPEVLASFQLTLSQLVANNAPTFEAEALVREVLAYHRKMGDTRGRDGALTLGIFAALVRVRGDLDEAERLIRDAIEIHRTVRGDLHPETVGLRLELALIHRDRGEFDFAESILREVIRFRSEALGEVHRDTTDGQVALATVMYAKGNSSAALPLLENAVVQFRAKFGADNIYTVRVEAQLASVMATMGKPEAEPLFRHALKVQREVLGERSETATSLHELGVFLANEERLSEAEPVLQEALTMRRKVRGEDHRETTETRRVLASIDRAQD